MEADAGAWEVWGALRDDRLDAYENARASEQEAKSALAELQCRAKFTVEDGDGEDTWTFEESCLLPTGHAGTHDCVHADSPDVPSRYRDAVDRYRSAIDRAARAHELWEEADEAFDALQCHQPHPTDAVWPCVRRRGHDGAHEHPTAMTLVV